MRDDANRTADGIVVVGSSMVDLITYIRRAPLAGETLTGSDFRIGAGGKGANQAVMAARLGSAVSFVGRVGSDAFAQLTFDALRAEAIDIEQLRSVPGPSGVASIWVEEDGANRIAIVAGANDTLDADSTRAAIAARSGTALVLAQLETPQEATIAAFAQAHEQGAVTVLNPAPWAPLERALIAESDWIVPNEHEFAELARSLGIEPGDAGEHAINGVAAELGTSVVVTRGDRDVVIAHGGESTVVPVESVAAVDTTGAGDAFVGAFAHGLAGGMEPVRAAEIAARCATASVLRHGTQTSFPTSDEIAALLDRA